MGKQLAVVGRVGQVTKAVSFGGAGLQGGRVQYCSHWVS